MQPGFGQGAWRWVIGAGAVLSLAAPASARPAHLKALGEHYGTFLPVAAANCTACHLPSSAKAPASLAEFPHNAFGNRLRLLGEELAAAGKRSDLASRLRAVAGEDADGDGVPNQQELLSGHRPGDPKDRPTSVELAKAGPRFARFTASLAAYRWRPFEAVQRPPVPGFRVQGSGFRVQEGRTRTPGTLWVAERRTPNAERRTPNAHGWARNPIDAFIAAEHRKRGLAPRPEASRLVLLRRAYLDLTGLSPTPEEQRAFLADRSADAYEKVVDRLLASPQYGERWGRHWMDVWRYSDWAGWGEQVRDSQPHIWRWRDWIVESLNADNGYDRMVQEMLAADELAPDDPDALRGTGYLVRNFKLLSREKWMQDVVDYTGQAFLGLTVGCARCHDHMYDPITQKEYYQLRAVFEPHQVRTDWVPGEADVKRDGLPRAYDAAPDAPTYFYTRGDERQPVKDTRLAPGVPQSLGGRLAVQPVPLPLLARAPERQPHAIAAIRSAASARVAEARRQMGAGNAPPSPAAQAKLDAAEAALAALEAVLRVERIEDAGRKDSDEWRPAAAEALRRQRLQTLAEALAAQLDARAAVEQAEARKQPAPLKKAQDALAAAEEALKKARTEADAPAGTAYRSRAAATYPAASTGRRLALARWIASRENPLAARVAVNQIWMRHFGEGLLPSVSDFGRNGSPPTHPQLLDWLAAELMEGNWAMKRMHRLIMTSATYRQASTPDPACLVKDPDNRYLWRMSSRRMDAEIVRDNVLWVAGQLDPKRGGPDIDQNLGMSVKRRTLYFRHAAEKEMVFLGLFDGPSVLECYRRQETVVPQQALALANSELVLVQARLLARSLAQKAGADPGAFVAAAFERVLARPATAAEQRECLAFMARQAERLPAAVSSGTAGSPADGSKPSADPALRARESLVMVLLNHNDFVTIR